MHACSTYPGIAAGIARRAEAAIRNRHKDLFLFRKHLTAPVRLPTSYWLTPSMSDATQQRPSAPATLDASRAPVVRVEIAPHPHDSNLEVANLPGARVVVPRGFLRQDDLAVFLAAGTELPEWLLRALGRWDPLSGYGTLRGPEHNRVRIERVRGVVSHGLLLKGALLRGGLDGEPCFVVRSEREGFALSKEFREGDYTAGWLGIPYQENRVDLISKFFAMLLHTSDF